MSHPIDDLFKRGLGNESYEGHKEDWPGARALLGLDKHKKRRPIWFWLAGLGLLVVIIAGSLFFKPENSPDAGGMTILDPQDIDVQHAPDKTISASNIPIPPQSAALILNETDIKFKAEKDRNNTAPGFNQNKLEQNHQTSSDSKKNDNLLVSVIKTPDLQGFQTVQPPVVKSLDDNDVAEKYSDQQLDIRSELSLPAQIINADNSHSLTATPLLTRLIIQEFIVPLESAQTPSIVALKMDDKRYSHFEFGVYMGWNAINSNLFGGVAGTWNIKSSWSVDMGVGIARFASSENQLLENVSVANRQFSLSNINSENNYKYYSLQIPIRANFHMQRHRLFGGAIAERPFNLKGRQEVTLTPEALDTAVPSDPIQGSVDPGPILTIQDYNLNTAPELKKIFLYGQIGYGYNISDQFDISIMTTYRLTSQVVVSPLIDSAMRNNNSLNPWGLLIRMDYRFGR